MNNLTNVFTTEFSVNFSVLKKVLDAMNETYVRIILEALQPSYRRAYQILKLLEAGPNCYKTIGKTIGLTPAMVMNYVTELKKIGYLIKQVDFEYTGGNTRKLFQYFPDEAHFPNPRA